MSRMLLYSRVNPADRGGVQAVFRRLASSLREAGHTVEQAWALQDPEAGDWTRCYPLPRIVWRGRLPHPRSVLGALEAAWRLGAGLYRLRPDVVNYHFVTGEAFYFLLLKPLFRYKLVVSVHGSDVLRPKPEDAPLLPRILQGADAVTAVSQLTAARLAQDYNLDPARIRVIPNGVDPAFWGAAPTGPRLAHRPPTFLSVGRLHPVKGHDVLLRAFAPVAAARPDARLVIVGEGGFRAELEQLARQLGIAPQVEFAGHLGPDAVRARMATARVFVLPSRSEGLPLALLETMSAGLPVIATRVGGVPEVIDDATAILVAPEDPAGMAAALEAALADIAALEERATRATRHARKFTASGADAAYTRVLA